jgi:hypothetical protein
MRSTRQTSARFQSIVAVLKRVVVLAVVLLLVILLVNGRGLGLRARISSRIHRISNLGQAILDSRSVSSDNQGSFTNVVFLHHPTGPNLIEQGGIRERLTEAGYSLWDHGYSDKG